jgi:hypothetical protein
VSSEPLRGASAVLNTKLDRMHIDRSGPLPEKQYGLLSNERISEYIQSRCVLTCNLRGDNSKRRSDYTYSKRNILR